MKTIIAGGRDFTNSGRLTGVMITLPWEITQVVCGMAEGADLMGRNWALRHAVPVREFPPDWRRYGKSAGRVRNAEMVVHADALVAFWDGYSKGTKNIIDVALRNGLWILVVPYANV